MPKYNAAFDEEKFKLHSNSKAEYPKHLNQNA